MLSILIYGDNFQFSVFCKIRKWRLGEAALLCFPSDIFLCVILTYLSTLKIVALYRQKAVGLNFHDEYFIKQHSDVLRICMSLWEIIVLKVRKRDRNGTILSSVTIVICTRLNEDTATIFCGSHSIVNLFHVFCICFRRNWWILWRTKLAITRTVALQSNNTSWTVKNREENVRWLVVYVSSLLMTWRKMRYSRLRYGKERNKRYRLCTTVAKRIHQRTIEE